MTTGIAHGISTAVLLQGTGLTPTILDAPDALVEAGQELAVARNLVGHVGDKVGLGVEVGSHYNLASPGILGLALLSSATLREAFGTAMRFVRLSSAFVRMVLAEGGDEAIITFDDTETPADVRDFLTERDFSASLKITSFLFARILASTARLKVESRLDWARSESVRSLLSVAEVTPNRPVSRVLFSRQVLDEPLPTADTATARMCVQQCAALLERRREASSIGSVVRSLLLHDPQRFPPIRQIADRLGVSERSLRRQLAADNTSYQALLEKTRETLASELLTTTRLPVEQVARNLGYSETASFTRAFTRWCGVSPTQFRRAAR